MAKLESKTIKSGLEKCYYQNLDLIKGKRLALIKL